MELLNSSGPSVVHSCTSLKTCLTWQNREKSLDSKNFLILTSYFKEGTIYLYICLSTGANSKLAILRLYSKESWATIKR